MAQSQFSISISEAQPDFFREILKSSSIDSLSEISQFSDSLEISNLQDSALSLSSTKDYIPAILKNKRIAIQTTFNFDISHSRIHKVLEVTENQINTQEIITLS